MTRKESVRRAGGLGLRWGGGFAVGVEVGRMEQGTDLFKAICPAAVKGMVLEWEWTHRDWEAAVIA